ncbi:hypothetical protein D3C80_1318300 [compost metagenome]
MVFDQRGADHARQAESGRSANRNCFRPGQAAFELPYSLASLLEFELLHPPGLPCAAFPGHSIQPRRRRERHEFQHTAVRSQPTTAWHRPGGDGDVPVCQSRCPVQVPRWPVPDHHGGMGALSGAHLADGRDLPAQVGPQCAAHPPPAVADPACPEPVEHQPVVHYRPAVSAAGRSHCGQLPGAGAGHGLVGPAAQGAGDGGAVGGGGDGLYRRAGGGAPRRRDVHAGNPVPLRLGAGLLLLSVADANSGCP